MYIIFDEEYKVYRSERFTDGIGRLVEAGKISVIEVPEVAGFTYRGINLDKTWSEVNKWNHFGGETDESTPSKHLPNR